MKLSKETADIQNSLARYCRNGEKPSISVSRPDGLPHYRRLVLNVVKNTMKQAFPIAYKYISNEDWIDMVGTFFLNHDSQTPQVWKLPFEFYQFVLDQNYAQKLNKPYLNDLLLFEWIEIEMHTMPDQKASKHRKEGNLFIDILVVNPEFKMIRLSYPVHIHPPEKAKTLKGDYFVVAFRHPDELNVKFLNLSILHAYILEQLEHEEYTLNEIMDEALAIFHVDQNTLITNLSTFLNDLFEQRLIFGYKV